MNTTFFFFLKLLVHLLTSHLTWNLIWKVAQRISCHRTQQNVCGADLILVSSAQACAVGVLPCRTALRRMARESLHSKTARVPERERLCEDYWKQPTRLTVILLQILPIESAFWCLIELEIIFWGFMFVLVPYDGASKAVKNAESVFQLSKQHVFKK